MSAMSCIIETSRYLKKRNMRTKKALGILLSSTAAITSFAQLCSAGDRSRQAVAPTTVARRSNGMELQVNELSSPVPSRVVMLRSPLTDENFHRRSYSMVGNFDNDRPTVAVAAGTGLEDDTQALQRALEEASGKALHLPCGTYRLTAPLLVPPGTTISADNTHPYYYPYRSGHHGPIPCALLKVDGNAPVWGATANLLASANSNELRVDQVAGTLYPGMSLYREGKSLGLNIIKQKSGSQGSIGTYIIDNESNVSGRLTAANRGAIIIGRYASVRGIAVDASATRARIAAFYSNQPFHQIHKVFSFGGYHGLWEEGSSHENGNQGFVVDGDSDFSTSLSDAVLFEGCYDFRVDGIWAHASQRGFALNLDYASQGSVTASVFEDSSAGGVRMARGTNNISLTGNKIDANSNAGLVVESLVGKISVVGNFFHNNGQGSNFGSHWMVTGNNTGTILAAGNIYTLEGDQTKYSIRFDAGASLNNSAFYEMLPPMSRGVFSDQATRDIVQPMLVLPASRVPGPYADDAAAGSEGIPLGAEYVDTEGLRRIRLR